MDFEQNSRSAGADVFWGEMSPSEHFVQIYDADEAFMDTLEGFIGKGLESGDSAIVIATSAHRRALETRLTAKGLDLNAARLDDSYIDLDAEESLQKFIVDGWPDDARFTAFVGGVLTRARAKGQKVRAFGEMVAIMWGRGDHSATVRLEHLWHKLCLAESFSLFCAYPKVGFTESPATAIDMLCATHSKVFPH